MNFNLKKFLLNEFFNPSILGFFINPFYLIKKGLSKGIKKYSYYISGNTLDIGCGSKPYLSFFKHCKKYIGIDVRDSSHNHNRSRVDIYYDGKTIPFPNNSFESVVCFEVLEHIKEADFTIKEISRVLNKDGKILLTTPFAWGEHELPNDYIRYTENGLKELLSKNNFIIEKIHKSNNAIESIMQIISLYIVTNLLPRNKLKFFFWPLVAITINASTLLLSFLLPKDYTYYSNLVLIAKKKI